MFKNVSIKLTNYCNVGCKHCYQNFEKTFINKRKLNIIYDKIKKFYKNFEKFFDINEVKIFYYGGEPLLLDYEILEYSFKKFDEFKNKYLQTSLVPLFDKNYEERKKYYELFKKYNLKLGTSYDFFGIRTYRGSEELYEKKLLEIVEELNDYGLNTDLLININKYIKNNENIVFEWLVRYKKLFNKIIYIEYNYFGNFPSSELYLTYEEISSVLIEFYKIGVLHGDVIFDNLKDIIYKLKNFNSKNIDAKNKIENKCIKENINISPNGEVTFCDFLFFSGENYGNIHEKELTEILKNKNKTKWFLFQNKYLEICNFCEFKNYCNTGCPIKKYNFIHNIPSAKQNINNCPNLYPLLKYIYNDIKKKDK